jgi:hypothetical protein
MPGTAGGMLVRWGVRNWASLHVLQPPMCGPVSNSPSQRTCTHRTMGGGVRSAHAEAWLALSKNAQSKNSYSGRSSLPLSQASD